jgi:hypothetical protein
MSAVPAQIPRTERPRRPKLRLVVQPQTQSSGADEETPGLKPPDPTPAQLRSEDPWRDMVLDGVLLVNAVVGATLADFASAGVVYSDISTENMFVVASTRTPTNWQPTPLLLGTEWSSRSAFTSLPGAVISSNLDSPWVFNTGRTFELPANVMVRPFFVPVAGTIATDPEVEESDPPAFAAFCQLREWLLVSANDVADLVGIGRTTPYNSWKKGGGPHPANARRLYQIHGLVEAMVQRLGGAGARAWLAAGDPSPFELMRRGDVEGATSAAQEMVFGRPMAGPEPGAVEDEQMPSDIAAGQKPTTRRSKTGRITNVAK